MADDGDGLGAVVAGVAEGGAELTELLGDADADGEDSVELHPATAARTAALQARARIFFMGIRIDEGSGPVSSLGERPCVCGPA